MSIGSHLATMKVNEEHFLYCSSLRFLSPPRACEAVLHAEQPDCQPSLWAM